MHETDITLRDTCSLSPRTDARGRQTAEEHVVHRRTPPDGRTERGGNPTVMGDYCPLLLRSIRPSVSGSLDAHPAAVVYAQPSTLHLTSSVLLCLSLRCRPSCNDGPIMEPSHINPRSSLSPVTSASQAQPTTTLFRATGSGSVPRGTME